MKKLRTCLQPDTQNSCRNGAELLPPMPYNDNISSANKPVMVPSVWNTYIPGTDFPFKSIFHPFALMKLRW